MLATVVLSATTPVATDTQTERGLHIPSRLKRGSIRHGQRFCNPSGTTKAFPTTITRTAEPANHVTTATYDFGSGKIKTFTDANGRATGFSYADVLDRLKTVTHPIGTTEYEYGSTPNNNLVRTKKSKGDGTGQLVTTETYFDGLGREKQTLVVGAASVEKQYDAMGRAYRVSLPSSGAATAWTETTFDELSRPVRVLMPDGASKLLTHYDGKTTTAGDEAGKWKRTESDGLGRLKKVIEDPGFSNLTIAGASYSNTSSFSPAAETIYHYDARDNLKEVDQGDRDRSFVYDGLSRLTSANNPESGIISYNFDKSGNVVSRTDARFTTTFRYDKLSRLKRKEYSDGLTAAVSYCYDGDTSNANGANCAGAPTASPASVKNLVGRMTRVFNDVATRDYSDFDALGRAVASSQAVAGVAQPYSFGYQYNDIALKQMTTPSGKTWKYDYDQAGRQYRVSKDGATLVTYGEITAFAPHGAPVTMTLGQQMQQSFGYNGRQQPASMQLVKLTAPSTPLLKLEYFYCAGEAASCGTNNGNMVRQKISHSAPGESALNLAWDFSYDKVNRLEDFSEQGTVVEANRYDRYGNRWAIVGAPSGSGTPSGADWFTASTNRMTGIGYDAAGNQTQFNPLTLAYDAENRVRTAGGSDGALYLYDGEGQRVKRVVCPGVTNCTESTSGAQATTYVYDAAGELTAEYGPAEATGLEFLAADHLGSTRALANEAGEVVKRYDYRPFGTELKAGVSGRSAKYPAAGSGYPGLGDGRTVKFTSKARDAETGLDYFGARYMAAAQGRFTGPDAPFADQSESDPQSWNLYSYVRNNPLRFIDPSGRTCAPNGSGGYKDIEGPGGTCADALRGDIAESRRPSVTVTAQAPPTPLLLALAFGTRRAEPAVKAAGVGTAVVMSGLFGGMAYGAYVGTEGIVSLGLLLLPSQARNIQAIDTIIADHVTMRDLAGGAKEAAGFTLRTGKKVWNHIQELKDARSGLARAVKNLEGSLNDPRHGSAARQVVQQAIQKGQAAIRQIDAALR